MEIPLASTGLALALASGVANGLFTTPMKLERRWRWEHLWAVFIVTSCLAMPAAMTAGGGAMTAVRAAPRAAAAAAGFGFLWGFGAICFGLSVDRLGVSLANSLVIGISSALGSLAPLALRRSLGAGERELWLYAGVVAFLAGVASCGRAGMLRDRSSAGAATATAYLLAIAAGVMSAVFNIGYALALPLAAAGERLGDGPFAAANRIWLLMLGAGSLPSLAYCAWLMGTKRNAGMLIAPGSGPSWGRAVSMGLLWGGSIFLYGAAAPRLGELGPAVGWPLSLAAGLAAANLMGVWLGEWRGAARRAVASMAGGLAWLAMAIVLCAAAARPAP